MEVSEEVKRVVEIKPAINEPTLIISTMDADLITRREHIEKLAQQHALDGEFHFVCSISQDYTTHIDMKCSAGRIRIDTAEVHLVDVI